MYSLGEAVGYIRLEMGKFLQEAQQAQTSTKQIEDEFDKLGNAAKSIEGIIVKSFAAIGAAVVSGLGAAVNVGSQFEASMSQVAATMGMTAEDVANGSADFEKLSAAAKEMGETTKFSASQAADALNYLALAGYDTEQAISTLPTVLNLAASGGMDLARASDMITDAASALGLGIDDMSLFADKMAKAAQSSNTSVEQLGNAILQIGGTAKNLSGGVTELNTALGILANNGIKSAEGGTALRQIILNLTAPTEKAAAYMEELGLKVADAAGNVRPLNDIFKDLDEILQSKGITGSADKIEALSQIFDARQLKSATALLNNYGESWDRLYEKIDNAEGASARMAETMETNLKGALTILGSTAEGFGITVYESIESSFKDAVQEATNQLSNLNNAFKSDEMQASMQKISDAISDAIVKLSEFLGETIPELVSGLSDLIDNFDKISAGIAGLATTIGLATAGMTLYKIQTDLVTQSLIAQKVAQLAANAAALANPYTLVALGIGVLVTALVGEYQQQQENIRQLDELNQKYYDTEAAVNAMADSYDKEIEKAKELESSRDNEINQVNELLGLIEKNVDESGNIVSNTEMVKDAIDELNSIIPTNIQYQGNQITNYADLTQASKDYCEQLKIEAELSAREEEYKTASAAYDEAIQKREDLTNAFYDAQKAYQDVTYAWEKMNGEINGYVSEYQEQAKAAGMEYRDYVNALKETSERALESTQNAYLENEKIIQDTRERIKQGQIEITKLTNDTLYLQLQTGQEVTGMFKTESDARIGVAELEAQRLAEIFKQEAEDKKGIVDDSADEIITAEEELEAKLEQLEIDFNTGVISDEEEYHKRRLELLENFQGEWTTKTSSWLKQERDRLSDNNDEISEEEKQLTADLEQLEIDFNTGIISDEKEYHRRRLELLENFHGEWTKKTSEWMRQEREYAQKQVDDEIEAEEKKYEEAEKQRQKDAENAKREEEEKNKNYFENLKYRADTDEEYRKNKYSDDLKAFQGTLEEGTDLYRQVGREIVNIENENAKDASAALRKPFEDLKNDKKYNVISWDEYIKGLEDYAATLDKTSDLYKEVMAEIEDAKEKRAKEEEDKNEEEFENYKKRKEREKDYTDAAYIADLKAFAANLDEKSDLYGKVMAEIENTNKKHLQGMKDYFEINEGEGYTLNDYLNDLNDFLATLDEGSQAYIDTQKEIRRVQDQISENTEKQKKQNEKNLEDERKAEYQAYQDRLRDDKTYTKQQYVDDLKLFAATLDKKSDLYEQVMNDIAAKEKEIDNDALQALKDKYTINKDNGYTLSDYLADLEDLLDTLDEGSQAYIDTQKEISRVKEDIAKDEQKSIDDNNKRYLQGLKNRLKEEKTYTKEMYLNDLLLFAETLDKESDLYQTVLNEIATVRQDISDENQKSADTAFKAWEKGFNSLKSEAEKAYGEIVKKQQTLENQLNDSIQLYDKEANKLVNPWLRVWDAENKRFVQKNDLKLSLNKQIKDLEDYTKKLDRLKERGASDELIAEIMGMSEEDREEYLKQLDAMSDDSFKAYNDTYTKLRQKNKEFAEKYYADEVDAFKLNWGEKVANYIATLPPEAQAAAQELIESFINGLDDNDFDTDNDAFNQIFAGFTSGFAKKIESGDLFENYGTKSVENLETEIEAESSDLSETTKTVGEDAGKSFILGFADSFAENENVMLQCAEKIGTSLTNNILTPLKSIKGLYNSVFGTNIPLSIFGNNANTPQTTTTTAQTTQQNQLTQKDIENAIKNSIPSGDVVMRIDGDRFAQITRKQLNILAQKNGRLGLNV